MPSIALDSAAKTRILFLPYLDLLAPYRGVFFYLTITPYGKDIEPGVKDEHQVIEDFEELSWRFGKNSVGWRYDPILISQKYNVSQHLSSFRKMAALLEGYTSICTISFLDLYDKVRRNSPEAKEVSEENKAALVKGLAESASSHGMKIDMCHEGKRWQKYGADGNGCMTLPFCEAAIGEKLIFPKGTSSVREG